MIAAGYCSNYLQGGRHLDLRPSLLDMVFIVVVLLAGAMAECLWTLFW